MPEEERLSLLSELPEEDALALLYDWRVWARPEQLAPPGDWDTWLIQTGRGWGKTRTGAEWIIEEVRNGAKIIGLVGATAADIRDTMVEGDSGILACCPPWDKPEYLPSKRHRLEWKNGAVAIGYTADEPNRLRGPNFQAVWCDELAAWRFLQEAWDMLGFATRKGGARVCITTTPRPLKLLKEIMADPGTVLTRGSLKDNSDNLSPKFMARIIRRYDGTRLGRQEIDGEVLDDVPGALWTRAMIDAARWQVPDPSKPPHTQFPTMRRVVVAIDPAVTSGEDSDDTGISVAGLGMDGVGYVIADQTCHETPHGWAQIAVNNYKHYEADRIVGEVNNGGDMVETTIRTVDTNVPYKAVHASRGKRMRAEPIAALYEQGRVKHLGNFPDLEDQMCNFVPDVLAKSPDRLDALVWALTELFLTSNHDEPEIW